MGYVYNPLLGAGFDQTSAAGGGATSPGGSTTQIQFNDAGGFGGDVDLTWNKTTNLLTVGGDINLSDGGTYTTTVQTITPTANRTISFPDATGTLALVAGSSGQLVYNNAGVNAGASTLTYDGSILTTSGRFINSYNASLATPGPAKAFTGTWFTSGGTGTTTKPHVLIEPTGTTSTAWSVFGTGFGVNAPSGFPGNLLDLQVNGTRRFGVKADGYIIGAGQLGVELPGGSSSPAADNNFIINAVGGSSHSYLSLLSPGTTFRLGNAGGVGICGTVTGQPLNLISGGVARLQLGSSGGLTVTDANDIAVGTTTGTKIGTATTQKLGFYNKTPVVQPAAVADATDAATAITQLNALLARMRDLGLIAT